MTHEEILTKAIEKASANGFSRFDYEEPELEYFDDAEFAITWHDPLERDNTNQSYHHLFDHDFAKALWGDKPDTCVTFCKCGYVDESDLIPTWQGKLQQMVIAEDPIKYLGSNI